MYGAILGDMVGAPYEFDQGDKTKDFEFWNDEAQFTDDTVMTAAVAKTLSEKRWKVTEDEFKSALIENMRTLGRRYPYAGYGARFGVWLRSNDPKPYGSYGNGSAMRVSPVGYFFTSLERVLEVAKWSAEVSHDHPEGIKGAQATAAVIFLLWHEGKSKEEIREYVEKTFGYDLSRTCDEIRPGYHHVESCQETVPEAITAFLEGEDFEDVIRTAVSLGGDCDTLTCIAGGMAEAKYHIPDAHKEECISRLPEDLREIMQEFYMIRAMLRFSDGPALVIRC